MQVVISKKSNVDMGLKNNNKGSAFFGYILQFKV